MVSPLFVAALLAILLARLPLSPPLPGLPAALSQKQAELNAAYSRVHEFQDQARRVWPTSRTRPRCAWPRSMMPSAPPRRDHRPPTRTWASSRPSWPQRVVDLYKDGLSAPGVSRDPLRRGGFRHRTPPSFPAGPGGRPGSGAVPADRRATWRSHRSRQAELGAEEGRPRRRRAGTRSRPG